ncbi:uncharacterized protein LOC143793313 [Ranitomeya variabilis]|uniref:uncharacterized protein LOC143793313 n=1 Tax=Ranitomeya variabilis TaxID=490064 RepID=UPI0040572014
MSPIWLYLLSLIDLVICGLGDDGGTGGAAQCRRPAGEGVIPAEKEFYNKGEDLQVRCQDGYRLSPLYGWARCTNPQTDKEWDRSPQCIAQCKKPENTDRFTILGEKTYYNVWESVSVRCVTGYRPLYGTITCVTGQKKDQWDNPPQCIGVNVTALEVTSTSLRLRIVCSPDQCHNPGTTYTSSCMYLRGVYKGCKTGEDVTFSGLEPVTQYEIHVTRVSGGSSLPLQTLYITTGESVPEAPEIVQTPSMEDTTIIWRLDSDKGNITRFELNIMAWRDYNSSFSINVTQRFPPNVTQYNINLQHGTNYTLHLRGFTSVGGGEYRKIALETPIGG